MGPEGLRTRFKAARSNANGLTRVEVLTVGRELLIGRTLNTNAHWVGKRLAMMGSMISIIATVDDDLDEISRALVTSLSRGPGFVVVIGGLGPTHDDMTLRGVAMGLKREMRLNRGALELMKEHYSRSGLPDILITPARRKMSVFPEGGTPLRNEIGTAPGVRLRCGKTVVFCLPGVPAEMRSIFAQSIEPEIRKSLGTLHRETIRLQVEGMLESVIAPIIGRQAKRVPSVYVKSHPGGIRKGISRIEVDVSVVKESERDATSEAEEVADAIASEVRAAGASVLTRRFGKARKGR